LAQPEYLHLQFPVQPFVYLLVRWELGGLKMKWHACMVVVVVVASCGDNLSEGTAPYPPIHVSPPVNALPPVDVPPIDPPPGDPPPSDLAKICGAEPVTLDDWETCYQKRWCEWRVGCLPMNSYLDVPECIARSDDVEGGRLSAELRERKRAVAEQLASI